LVRALHELFDENAYPCDRSCVIGDERRLDEL